MESSAQIVLPLLAMFILASVIAAAALLMGRFLGPSKLVGPKVQPYECGIPPTGGARDRVSVKYYLVAILFLLFDLEAAFLLPAALSWNDAIKAGLPVLVTLGFFLVFLLVGLGYEFLTRALDWEA